MVYEVVYEVRGSRFHPYQPSCPVRVEAFSHIEALVLAKDRLGTLFQCEIGLPVSIKQKVED